MGKTQEEHDEIYISGSKQNIDSFINKNDYRKAFGLFLFYLEKLDDGAQKTRL